MDNAKSVRKEDMKMKHVDTARKDDRKVENLLEFIEGGESLSGGGREKKQKRKKKKSSPTGNAEGDDADIGTWDEKVTQMKKNVPCLAI